MNRNLSPERRRIVVLCACVACMSGGPVLLRGHLVLMFLWLAMMLTVLVTAMVKLARLNKSEGRG